MNCSLPLQSLCLLLLSLTLLCSGQRCMLPDGANRFTPLCAPYYSPGIGYFSGSQLRGLNSALQRISEAFDSVYNQNPCVDLMLNYLCYYYFPLCNLMTETVTPVCNTSCFLLELTVDCPELRDFAYAELQRDNIAPPGESCSQTYRSYVNPPRMFEDCFAIEDTMNTILPLQCNPVPDETCISLIPYTHYVPGSNTFTEELGTEITEIISEFEPFDDCRIFSIIVLCQYRYPACDPTTGQLFPICTELCPTVDSNIQNCALESYDEYPAVGVLFTTFECSEPETYIMNIPPQYISNSSVCTPLTQNTTQIPSPTDSEDSDDSLSVGGIIGLVAGTCAVVVIIILLVLLIRLKKKFSKKYASKNDSSNEYSDLPSAIRYRSHHHDSHLALDINYPSNAPSPYFPHRRLLTAEALQNSRSSLLLEVNQFLQYVKDKFSEVLLPVESISKQGLLGKGAFGVVHKGEMISSDRTVKAVAIKTIKSGSLDAMKDLVAESAIMKTFHHPNVLPLLGVCIDYDDEDMLKIIIPFMANGDLRTYLKDSRISPNNTQEYPENLSEETLMKMCFDIAKGMEYLAGKRFIHRDLAARNCMVDTLLSIKIADFGLAKDIYSAEYYRMDKHTRLPAKWMSLESLLDGYFDEKTDVWSYGITCWEVFSLGRIPYPGVDNADVISLLKSGKRLEQPELCPLKMNELMKSTWLENPDKRPTFAVIVQNLSNIYNFTNDSNPDEDSTTHAEDTAESNGYISVVPT